MTTVAIIVAAGRGTRAGGSGPKQWQPLCGRPLVAQTLDAFAGMDRVLVIHPDDHSQAAGLGVPLVHGGASRTASVRNALEGMRGTGVTRVLIHDGARPLVSRAVIDRVLAALDHAPGAAPALPVTDALWRGEDRVTGTEDRTALWRAQTPQGFHYDALMAAYDAHPQDAADDVEIARAAGLEVTIVQGCESNMKVTWPADLARAERMLKDARMDIRLGNGYDVHRFGPGDHVWLCGIKVPHGRGLQGHSDADVGMHALTDAIYGALAEGDIGRHFPPSDMKWKGAASHIFLEHAMKVARDRGYRLANCDVTLVCEYPKVGPHAAAMQEALARIMGVDVGRVSVKATTSEKLGFTGREEGIAAIATAALIAE